ncbi:MAG: hypothetical protein L6W00_12835 [Lentisphaeria bacterium]|nr:MAG: hypothetical protein L6W00_12835 [Lentisphaeria bacterium]
MALAVEQVLDGGDPGPVVVNIQTSRLVEAIAASYHCGLVISKVGEINVVEKMIETDSMIGGEGNCGGVIYRRVHSGRDSFTAMALILERLAFFRTAPLRDRGGIPRTVQFVRPLPGSADRGAECARSLPPEIRRPVAAHF